VLIKNPKGWQQYGNNVAGPVFKEIADNIYSRDINLHMAMEKKKVLDYGVFPVIQAGMQDELTMLCNELGVSNHTKTEDDWIRAVRNGNSVLWSNNTPAKDQVPNVKGMTFRDALFLLETAGLQVDFEGKGRVVEQSILPGTKVSKGRKIHIRLS
jgi:cell division protein FtsI (penicillin-binding protein 3)